jgi:hypothetical protein
MDGRRRSNLSVYSLSLEVRSMLIYTRKTKVLWRNHCEDELQMVNGYVGGE